MKSQVMELLELAECIYIDATAKCSAEVSCDNRDLAVMRSRVEDEGMSFLTITLPTYATDLERSLANGCIEPGSFRAFRKNRSIPAFLQGMISMVFDRDSGFLKPEPCIAAIEGIRQIANAFKKVKLDCTKTRVERAYQGYLECERDLSVPLDVTDIQDFLEVSWYLWPSVVGSIDPLTTVPRHGPGATAERISGNQKYVHKKWHERLEPYFPFASFGTSVGACEEGFEDTAFVTAEHEQPVRVITVPKTLKSPRIIAIEPVCMQYTQQAISRELYRAIESHPVVGGQVNFTNQSINRELAIDASRRQHLATLDMSSASDRVPLTLAIAMFESNPDLQGAILACRSMRADVQGEVISLRKFASMGSALCFPVEAMYFYTICVMASIKAEGLPITRSTVRKAARSVWVYGDDIIVPTPKAETTCLALARYYCKVNTAKSFWTGKFRESCGMDAYDGHEVTPVYIRHLRPDGRNRTTGLISWVDSSNQFYKKGYWRTAAHMASACEHILGKLPIVNERSSALGLHSYQRGLSRERWSKRYHRHEVKAWVPSVSYKHSRLNGYAALTKCLLRLEDRPLLVDGFADDQHLIREPRNGAVALKRRWTCAY